jgi:hypothetical protein
MLAHAAALLQPVASSDRISDVDPAGRLCRHIRAQNGHGIEWSTQKYTACNLCEQRCMQIAFAGRCTLVAELAVRFARRALLPV